jgi:hexosaminidase
MTVQQPATARYIKIKLVNYGIIPENNSGVGNKAWLFVDELEVN